MRYLGSSNVVPIAGVRNEPGSTPLLATASVLVFIGVFAFLPVRLRVF